MKLDWIFLKDRRSKKILSGGGVDIIWNSAFDSFGHDNKVF